MKQAYDDLRFRQVYVEITNICNLSCRMCPKTKRAPKWMSAEEFEHVLGEIYPFTRYVYPHVVGEPLCHPEFEKILDICSSHGFTMNITTNGTLIGKHEKALLNSKCIRQLNFSVHSSWENGIFDENYVRSILAFADKRTDSSPKISFRMWTSSEKSAAALNMILSHYGKTKEEFDAAPSRYATGKALRLAENTYLNSEDEFVWPSMSIKEGSEDKFCRALRTHIGILSDGTVVPCCLDSEGEIALGNVFKESFADIINNDRTKAIYDGFSRRKAVEDLCKRCGYCELRLKK